jgi:hypothetical protein
MSDHQALRMLASGRDDADVTPDQQARVSVARASVAARAADLDQDGIVAPRPAVLAAHETALRSSSPTMFDEGWKLGLVDISRVCAFQPAVYTAQVHERAAGVDAEDLAALAALTLPLAARTPLRASFDEARNA